MSKIKVGITRKRFTQQEFNRIATCQLHHDGFERVKAAYQLAEQGHFGQYRIDKSKYFEHPKAVALIVMLECGVFLPNPICLGLMHDLFEKSHILTWWGIKKLFGKDICRGSRTITKEDGKDYYGELLEVEKKDWWVQLVKLADILHNFRTMLKTSKSFRSRQLEEKCRVYPLLLESLADKIPRDRYHVIDYLRKELDQASNLIKESLKPRVN
jgi:GTP pyrophosphokinase